MRQAIALKTIKVICKCFKRSKWQQNIFFLIFTTSLYGQGCVGIPPHENTNQVDSAKWSSCSWSPDVLGDLLIHHPSMTRNTLSTAPPQRLRPRKKPNTQGLNTNKDGPVGRPNGPGLAGLLSALSHCTTALLFDVVPCQIFPQTN